MSIKFRLPEETLLKPSITVFGIGGAGGNAVNNMISSSLEGVKFVAANTDAQALEYALTDKRIQLGENITKGLGAGASPDVGRAAAEEAMDIILEHLHGSNMVFITAGMGGGTGTGAAPVVARAARENGILTVGVVTKPFHFEGAHRMKLAESGLQELQKYVDTLIVIPNQNLFRIANEKTTFADAFKMADEVLHAGVRGITDLMIMPGLINLDFADIRSVMSEMGKAMMGTGEAEGDKRAIRAAEAAIANPLLDNCSMKGARGVLINITGGMDMTLFEVDEAANRIRDEVDADANIIFGSAFNQGLDGRLRVSVVATGIDAGSDLPTDKVTSRTIATPVTAPASENKAPEPFRKRDTMTMDRSETLRPLTRSVQENDIAPSAIQPKTTSQKPYQEETVNFVMPKPVEPKLQATVEKTIISEEHPKRDTGSSTSNHQTTSHENKGNNRLSLGLWERMANSVGLGVTNTQVTPAQARASITTTSREEARSEDGEVMQEDLFDIPAFLRRKKN